MSLRAIVTTGIATLALSQAASGNTRVVIQTPTLFNSSSIHIQPTHNYRSVVIQKPTGFNNIQRGQSNQRTGYTNRNTDFNEKF
jgi:hypothetical protein